MSAEPPVIHEGRILRVFSFRWGPPRHARRAQQSNRWMDSDYDAFEPHSWCSLTCCASKHILLRFSLPSSFAWTWHVHRQSGRRKQTGSRCPFYRPHQLASFWYFGGSFSLSCKCEMTSCVSVSQDYWDPVFTGVRWK